MKSIYNYYQPDFYHFSRNSIELAKAVFEERLNLEKLFIDHKQILLADFFSGSGVVHFEFLLRMLHEVDHHLMKKKWIVDAVEKQAPYLPIWQNNLALIGDSFNSQQLDLNFVNQDLFEKPKKKYDIILANPPFFSEDRSTVSSNEQKRTCHFMKESELKALPKLFFSYLRPGGVFYFLAHSSSVDIFWKEEIKKGDFKVFKELRDAVIISGFKLDEQGL